MPAWPCPECGAKKGQAHGNTCSHRQRRAKLPKEPRPGKNYGTPCPPHNPKPFGKKRANGDVNHRCSKCKRMLGWW